MIRRSVLWVLVGVALLVLSPKGMAQFVGAGNGHQAWTTPGQAANATADMLAELNSKLEAMQERIDGREAKLAEITTIHNENLEWLEDAKFTNYQGQKLAFKLATEEHYNVRYIGEVNNISYNWLLIEEYQTAHDDILCYHTDGNYDFNQESIAYGNINNPTTAQQQAFMDACDAICAVIYPQIGLVDSFIAELNAWHTWLVDVKIGVTDVGIEIWLFLLSH